MSTNGLDPISNRAAIEARLLYLEDHEQTIRTQLERNLSEQYELYCELANPREETMRTNPRYRLTVHRGGWSLAFLLGLAVDLIAWWQHHVWIAGSLAFVLAILILMRDDA